MVYRFSHHHKSLHKHLYVYINGILKLTIKNIEQMATISIDVEDNQADLDALKTQVATAAADLSTALANAQAALTALQSFQISFTASVAPQA